MCKIMIIVSIDVNNIFVMMDDWMLWCLYQKYKVITVINEDLTL